MPIKLLDAHLDLSIQVHPDDTYVRDAGLGTYRKTEAWYVLRSDDGRIVYGLKPGVGRAELEEAMRDRRAEEIVRFVEVEAGDVVSVPPGTVHALCRGVMVYEVQQSSDLTFRRWDYNRRGADGLPRALHRERALDFAVSGAGMLDHRHWSQ